MLFFFTLYQMNAKYMSQYCGSQNSGCSLLLYQGHSSLSVSIKDMSKVWLADQLQPMDTFYMTLPMVVYKEYKVHSSHAAVYDKLRQH